MTVSRTEKRRKFSCGLGLCRDIILLSVVVYLLLNSGLVSGRLTRLESQINCLEEIMRSATMNQIQIEGNSR